VYEKKQINWSSVGKKAAIVFGAFSIIIVAAIIFVLANEITVETRDERAIRIEKERREFSESLTLEQLVYDFDYFMGVLEENFPFFGVAYRRFGVCIHSLGDEFRANLLEGVIPQTAQDFHRALDEDFTRRIYRMAHLHIITRTGYVSMLDAALRYYEDNPINAFTLELLTENPNIAHFYGDADAIDKVEYTAWRRGSPDNITTEIIEHGRIAYMGIQRMLSRIQPEDTLRVRALYNQIDDFEHLIIDIRGNGGGWIWYPHEIVTMPLLERFGIRYQHLVFYKGGQHNMRLIDHLGLNRHRQMSFRMEDHWVIGRHNVTLFRDLELMGAEALMDDLTGFDYYNAYTFVLRREWAQFESNFSGRLWILTDGDTASAASQFAAIHRRHRLATLVGDTTMGVHGSPTMEGMHFSLPNTGILIRYDMGLAVCRATGLIYEEGIPPDYFNLPGMDALETVLAIINGGA